MPASLLSDLARGLLDLLFAPVCLGCRGAIHAAEPERLVCRACWTRLRPVPPPRCERCWAPRWALLPGEAPGACTVCAELPPPLRCVRSAFVLQDPLRELVHALKYGGWTALAEPLGARMAALPLSREAEEEVEVVIPVPLGRERRRERGYNQAELLARVVARERGWRCRPDLLVRARSTASQTALHPAERRANVARAFALPAGLEREVRRHHVLLLDDVWTTGATALACCEALLAAGARAVSVLTLARALPELQR